MEQEEDALNEEGEDLGLSIEQVKEPGGELQVGEGLLEEQREQVRNLQKRFNQDSPRNQGPQG